MIAGQAYMDLNTTYFASYVNLAPQFGYYTYGDAVVGRTAQRPASSGPVPRDCMSC